MTTAHNCPELTAVQGDLIISQRGSREDYNVVVPPPPALRTFVFLSSAVGATTATVLTGATSALWPCQLLEGSLWISPFSLNSRISLVCHLGNQCT